MSDKSADELAYENTGLKMELFHMQERMGYMKDTINILKSIPNPPRWRAIESVPRDGTWYLASNGSFSWVENWPEGCAPGDWHMLGLRWSGHAGRGGATHWMPLPPPPEVEG